MIDDSDEAHMSGYGAYFESQSHSDDLHIRNYGSKLLDKTQIAMSLPSLILLSFYTYPTGFLLTLEKIVSDCITHINHTGKETKKRRASGSKRIVM